MTLNPLDWPGQPFLALYGLIATGALLIIGTLRSRIGPHRGGPASPLDEVELGYLAGGPARAADTILVALMAAGAAAPAVRGDRIEFDPTVAVAPPWRRYQPEWSGGISRREFHARTIDRLDPVDLRLRAYGLRPDSSDVDQFRRTGAVVLAVPLVLGMMKVVVGSQRHRPVDLLVLLMIGTVVIGATLLLQQPLRTEAGSAALDQTRRRNARAARAPLTDELPLAFALTGAAVLLGTPLDAFGRKLQGTGTMAVVGCGGGGGGSGCGGGGGCGGCGG